MTKKLKGFDMVLEERKKESFPRFPSFQFCPIPKIENLEILESFILLQLLIK